MWVILCVFFVFKYKNALFDSKMVYFVNILIYMGCPCQIRNVILHKGLYCDEKKQDGNR